MKLQDRLLIPEDAFGVIAELTDVLSIEEEVSLLGGLPGPRPKELVDHALVGALHRNKRVRLGVQGVTE